jgi:membrane associated rhomboid family serine protease
MDLFTQLKEKIKQISMVEKLIYLLIAIFVIEKLLITFSFFNDGTTNFVLQYFSLSSSLNHFLTKPYTLISYSFLHGGFIHLIFNLIVLYYIGNLFLDYFNEKKFLIYFILGSVFGGILFLLSYNYFNVFNNQNAYLVGASASITAIMVGLATRIPNFEMNFRFIGYVKLWMVTAIWVLLSFILIPNGNAGGQIAHLGGAIIGFILTKYYFLENNVKPKFILKKQNKSNLKMVYKNDQGLSNYQKKGVKQRKIDALLDKISNSGYDVLTEEEKEFLDHSSKD